MRRAKFTILLCAVLVFVASVLADAAAARPARTQTPSAHSRRPRHHRHHRHRRHRRTTRRTTRHTAKRLTRPSMSASPTASPTAGPTTGPTATPQRAAAPTPLRFGVYPWAGAGAVADVQPQLADQPYAAMDAVKALAGGKAITVHLYGQYTGANSGEADALISDARWWSDNGVRVEMVLRYRPARQDLAAAYQPWVQNVSTRLAAIPLVGAIQVGNEPNNTTSAAAGDGAYPGAVSAIAHAVPVARAAVVASGRPDIAVGFNWAAGPSPCQLDPLFSRLRTAGGSAFVSAVGFVGMDMYPGTWSAPARSATPSTTLIASSMTSGLRCLRQQQMPSGGLGGAVPIAVAETGYPTGSGRSEASQAAVLRAIVGAVRDASGQYGVSDLRWFDLRDANTGSGQLENSYGLLRDDYSQKPAYSAFQQLIAAYGR